MSRLTSACVFGALSLVLLAAAGGISQRLLKPHNSLPSRGNACLPLASVPGPPVLKLELAWRDEDVVQIVTPTPKDEGASARNIEDVRAGNRWDTWLFVPTYALLLLTLSALASSLGPGFNRLFVTAAVLIGLIAAGDWLENYGIAQALNHLQAGGIQPGDARAISNPALVKWSLLSIVIALIGLQFLGAKRRWTTVLGLVAIAFGVFIGYGLVTYTLERLQLVETAVTCPDVSKVTLRTQGDEPFAVIQVIQADLQWR